MEREDTNPTVHVVSASYGVNFGRDKRYGERVP